MSVSATFFVSLGSTGPGFLYPGGRGKLVAVEPPPGFVGESISVLAFVADTDPALDALLEYDQIDATVSPDVPAEWSPQQQTLTNDSERWRFVPASPGTLQFAASFKITGSHPASGQTVSASIALQILPGGTRTIGELPCRFWVRPGPAGTAEIEVPPGQVATIPGGKRVRVRCETSGTGPKNANWWLAPASDFLPRPAVPADWAIDTHTADQVTFTAKAKAVLNFAVDALLFESVPAPDGTGESSERNHRHGTAGFALVVDPKAKQPSVASPSALSTPDPAQPDPDDIHLANPLDLDGNWYDENGKPVVIYATSDAISMQFMAGQGTFMTGTRQDDAIAPQGTFAGTAELPWPAQSQNQKLVPGTQVRFDAKVSPDGRTIAGQLNPTAQPSLVKPAELTLWRSPLIYSVTHVTSSLRDLIVGVDADRPWQDQRLSRAFDWLASTSPERPDLTHILLVVGAFLPQERPDLLPDGTPVYTTLAPSDFVHDDAEIVYEPDRMWKNRDTASRPATLMLAPEIAAAVWDQAWDQIAQNSGMRQMLQMREHLDAILVQVKPKPGALPGVKQFSLGGTPVQWVLDTPVTAASLDIVRNVIWSDVFLSVESVCRNGDFQLQLTLEAAVKMDSFNARIKLAGGRTEQVELTRTGDSKVYRSVLLMLALPGKAPSQAPGIRVIEAADNDFVVELEDVLVRLAQPALKIHVNLTPGDTNTLWIDYLHRAARVHGVDDTDRQVVETFYNVVVFDSSVGISLLPPGFPAMQKVTYIPLVRNYTDLRIDIPIPIGVPGFATLVISPGVRSTKVTLGDHAAILALRDKFSQMLQNVRDTVNHAAQTAQEQQAYLQLNYWSIVQGQDMLSKTKVGNAQNKQEDLRLAIRPAALRTFFKDRASANQFARQATAEAMTKLVATMDTSLADAKIADDAIKDLLGLTGTGFKPIVSRLMPMFVERELLSQTPGDYVWKSDSAAVRWLGDVEYVAALLRANKDLAAADTNVVLAVGSLVPVFMAAGLIRALIQLGIDLFGLIEMGLKIYEERRELAFALGATPVLGRDRLNVAEASQTPLWAIVLQAGLSVLASGLDLAEVVKEASVPLARLRARNLLARFEEEGLAGLKAMSPSEQRDLLIAMFDARLTARDVGGAVDAATARLLRAADRLESEALAAARAARQQGLAQQVEKALEDGLPQALRGEVPVIRDPSMPPAQPGAPASVEIRYDIDADGFVQNLQMRVAPGAAAADVASHADALQAMFAYTKQASEARSALSRLRRWISRYGEPAPGTLAWEFELEVSKLTSIITEDRLDRLSAGLLDPNLPAVQQEISWLGEQMAYYNRMLDTLEASPGRGFVAAWTYDSVRKAHDALHGGPPLVIRQTLRPIEQEALGELQTAVRDELQLLGQFTQDAQFAQHARDSVESILLKSDVFKTDAPARLQRVFAEFEKVVPNAADRVALMKMPGIADTLTDLIRHPLKKQGAAWVLDFNRRVLQGDPALPQELKALIGDITKTRGFEDFAGAMPKWMMVAKDDELVVRNMKQGIDQILEQGHLLEFKSYSNWTDVARKIGRQSFEQMVRYAELGWKDLSGRSLSGQWIFVVERSRLKSLPADVDKLAVALGDEVTREAAKVFSPPPQIKVSVFVP